MFSRRILELKQWPSLTPYILYTHSKTCPAAQASKCPGKGGSKKGSGGGASVQSPDIKRGERSAPVRYGFIPEEWFLFFHSKTGVSGPYLFGIGVGNYLFSKEVFVMEHEYYGGLSIALILYLVTTRLGPAAGAALDKEVDDLVASWQKGRNDDINFHETSIKDAETAQWMAEGQQMLMDAKKENIAMQLEAVYRERMMHVYRSVRGRMDYHVKRYRSEARIHQRWMIGWILENVRKSITPDFEKQALDSAIRDLAAAAGRAK